MEEEEYGLWLSLSEEDGRQRVRMQELAVELSDSTVVVLQFSEIPAAAHCRHLLIRRLHSPPPLLHTRPQVWYHASTAPLDDVVRSRHSAFIASLSHISTSRPLSSTQYLLLAPPLFDDRFQVRHSGLSLP